MADSVPARSWSEQQQRSDLLHPSPSLPGECSQELRQKYATLELLKGTPDTVPSEDASSSNERIRVILAECIARLERELLHISVEEWISAYPDSQIAPSFFPTTWTMNVIRLPQIWLGSDGSIPPIPPPPWLRLLYRNDPDQWGEKIVFRYDLEKSHFQMEPSMLKARLPHSDAVRQLSKREEVVIYHSLWDFLIGEDLNDVAQAIGSIKQKEGPIAAARWIRSHLGLDEKTPGTMRTLGTDPSGLSSYLVVSYARTILLEYTHRRRRNDLNSLDSLLSVNAISRGIHSNRTLKAFACFRHQLLDICTWLIRNVSELSSEFAISSEDLYSLANAAADAIGILFGRALALVQSTVSIFASLFLPQVRFPPKITTWRSRLKSLSDSMPWTIPPALLILWSVVWMYYGQSQEWQGMTSWWDDPGYGSMFGNVSATPQDMFTYAPDSYLVELPIPEVVMNEEFTMDFPLVDPIASSVHRMESKLNGDVTLFAMHVAGQPLSGAVNFPGQQQLPGGSQDGSLSPSVLSGYSTAVSKQEHGKCEVKDKHPLSTKASGKSKRLSHFCRTCAKPFQSGKDLKRHHLGVHQKLKPDRCEVNSCNKRFSRMDNMQRHMRYSHSIEIKSKQDSTTGSKACQTQQVLELSNELDGKTRDELLELVRQEMREKATLVERLRLIQNAANSI